MRAAAVCVAVGAVCVMVLLARRAHADRFGTPYASEQPTRGYVPYAGAVPLGEWGSGIKPWAEAHDLEPPKKVFWWLPPPYRTFEQVL